MITLSVPNCSDLSDGIDELLRCFRRLRQRSYWKNNVDGGAFVIEVKGNPGNWHPHIHAIVASHYLNWNKLHQSWNQVSGGLSVYISNIPKTAIVNYILKYLTKPSVSLNLLQDVAFSLKSKRLFQPFGSWHSPFNKLPKIHCVCSKCGSASFEPVYYVTGWRNIFSQTVNLIHSDSKSEKLLL